MDKIRRPAIFLLIGDWFALGLFVFLGQLDHGMVGINPLPRLLRTSIEIGLPWTVVALLGVRISCRLIWYFGLFLAVH